ncbi:threonine dehydrogenase-like Zn-dependent dehydrogenase [Ruminiclostridium sufflavum DSM 19573]|uniref:Threonine dehydrogenase-like Zn-dependent dehydrogenase n=1 Tax=Ruminiclostridium sufflavum DSM 19573 TaxID=1121337 RepID=A0A318XGW6_9FIRM|nr:zinc-binding dehydrogenase [Ruminiclostridium sufflavum]PYG85795.1 threonine dehydrogenase-like Zn-dependent dehydrogenase [Ruminiclostridium sufflavum DSM 19573]
MKVKTAILVEPYKIEIQQREVSLGYGELLVKVQVCGLCNWELNHFRGILGNCPQTLGHEWAGIVVETGRGTNGFCIGDIVTVLPERLEGFAEYAAINYKNCYKVDPDIDIRYALGEPLKCIVTVLSAANIRVGDTGIIMGCGPMGLWCLQGMRSRFLKCLAAIDIDDSKLALAKKFGATHVINPLKEDAVKRISEITSGHMADFVIEGTGSTEVLNNALELLRPSGRGRLILMSSHEERSESFDFRKLIKVSGELIAAHPGYSLNQAEDERRAVEMLNSGVFDLSEIVTHQYKLDDIQKAFNTLNNKPRDYIKGVVVM